MYISRCHTYEKIRPGGLFEASRADTHVVELKCIKAFVNVGKFVFLWER